jgi:acetoin utilization deacetylase AcuC-like enzyme
MAGLPVFLEHPSSLTHETGSHPEQPARISAITEALAARDWLGFSRLESPAVERAVLTAVHPLPYVQAIEGVSARGGGHLDLDTVMSAGSYEAALHAAGGAVRMAELLLRGDAPVAFSAHRPPGHHASEARAMGFCLFNNVAVAAQYALDRLGIERVLILDWDVHHGNGTSDIFFASDAVLFVSIHQSPLYPGTGQAREVGSGPGTGYTVNLPVPPGSDDALYRSLVEHVVGPLARGFEPQLVLISAGYDAHVEDPLAECHVTEAGFAGMARQMRRICSQIGAPLGCVLEGGYALGALARSVAATLEALTVPLESVPGDEQNEVAPIARAAQERLVRWWPGVVPGEA